MSSVTAPPAISSIVAKVSSAKVKWNLWTKTKKKWDQLNKLETFDFVLTDRVVSRIYRLEEKSRVGEGHELPGGAGVAEMQSGEIETQFWEMLQCVHWLRHFWMILPIQFVIYWNDNNIFAGEAGHFVGEASTPQIP